MKTEIELAKQAGWEYADDDRGFEPLWRFAQLVRADEREVYAMRAWSCVLAMTDAETADKVLVAIRARSNT